jgi:DNA-directed RNA polymerase specialized sigma24 family protein
LDESRDEGSILETVAATGFGNTEAEVKNLDRREALAKGVKGLSESDRKLFELVFIQEKELKDVARSLSCEYAALKVRVSRLRHKLRKALEGKVDLT